MLAERCMLRYKSAQKQYINDNVIEPAAYASKNAMIPLVISFGKAGNIYQQLGFILRKSWGPNNPYGLAWPQRKKDGHNRDVHFDYYEHSGKEIKLLNIWMTGSNHTPSDEFLKIEQEIIKHIDPNLKIEDISSICNDWGIDLGTYGKHYMCPRCGHLYNSQKCPNCGEKCNIIYY